MAEGGTGLTFGKFDPPHRGHALLVDVALAHVDQLIVLVYDYQAQSIPAQLRAAWMREIHPAADVRVIPDEPRLDPQNTYAQAAHVRAFLEDQPVSVLFTSEAYGERFAQLLGARHVSIDKDRVLVPCTGTMMRRSPVDYLDWMEPCVRAHYVKRFAIVGPESTGKTDLCVFLAERFATLWVPEYGREYARIKKDTGHAGQWTTDEFYHIAREQERRENEFARRANRVLFCDTDVFSARIWHERYVGSGVDVWPVAPPPVLYLIPYPDVPFVADDIRDSEHLRYWMYERFVDSFERLGYRYEVLRGTNEERREQAVAAVERECAFSTTP
jgi:NadR type nicotinamide-nucleotide adenylyltransferase